MKKVIMTIAVVVVLMGISDKVQAGPWTRSAFRLGSSRRSAFRLGISRRSGRRLVLGRSSLTRSAFGLGRRGRYGRYGRSSTNVRVKYNERWNLEGGQRSYERSPDLTGKIIDGVITLGALAIISD